jgi:hypothetical protein
MARNFSREEKQHIFNKDFKFWKASKIKNNKKIKICRKVLQI